MGWWIWGSLWFDFVGGILLFLFVCGCYFVGLFVWVSDYGLLGLLIFWFEVCVEVRGWW